MINSQTYKRNIETDVILELALIDGQKPTSSTGLVDSRLFQGGNKLHAVMDKQTCLWYPKYDDGIIPKAINQKFTSFPKLLKHLEEYFSTRNIKVKEIID